MHFDRIVIVMNTLRNSGFRGMPLALAKVHEPTNA
jgi:hypothetical protein